MKKAKLIAYIIHDLIYVTFSKRQNYSDTEQSSELPGIRNGEKFVTTKK